MKRLFMRTTRMSFMADKSRSPLVLAATLLGNAFRGFRRPIFCATLVLCFALLGCTASGVLNALATWLPVAISGFDSFVAIAAPANPALDTVGAKIQEDFNDLDSAVAAANVAGAGQTGVPKVLAELNVVIHDIPTFEADISAAGGSISANDQKYIAAGAALTQLTLQTYAAELQSKSGSSPAIALATNFDTGCSGIESAPDGSQAAWVACDPARPIRWSVSAPQVVASAPQSTHARKPTRPKLGDWKRQFNAIARRYGHPEKQLHLSLAERLHLT